MLHLFSQKGSFMATAKKLPSGAWRTRATKTINGKKVTKSFTINILKVQLIMKGIKSRGLTKGYLLRAL